MGWVHCEEEECTTKTDRTECSVRKRGLTIGNRDMKRLKAAHMGFLRPTCGVTLTDESM